MQIYLTQSCVISFLLKISISPPHYTIKGSRKAAFDIRGPYTILPRPSRDHYGRLCRVFFACGLIVTTIVNWIAIIDSQTCRTSGKNYCTRHQQRHLHARYLICLFLSHKGTINFVLHNFQVLRLITITLKLVSVNFGFYVRQAVIFLPYI